VCELRLLPVAEATLVLLLGCLSSKLLPFTEAALVLTAPNRLGSEFLPLTEAAEMLLLGSLFLLLWDEDAGAWGRGGRGGGERENHDGGDQAAHGARVRAA
jgi:hypothetical protein